VKKMADIPFMKKMHPKSITIMFLIILIVFGLFFGILLSAGSINRANERLNEIDPEAEIKPGFPFLGSILVTINMFILIGLIYTHISIFRKTRSKFLIGLILFLVALFIKSLSAYNSIQLLTVATALEYTNIEIVEILGFSSTGFGGVFILYHIFEFIVLSIFFYVSRE
jgi:hypothetical protein